MVAPAELPNYVGLGVGILALASAFPIYFLAPSRRVNRFLAVLLFFEGTLFVSGPAQTFLDVGWTSRGLQGLLAVTFGVQPYLYLLFMGQALQTPLVKPFRTRPGQALLMIGALAGPAYYLFVVGLNEFADWSAWLGLGVLFGVSVFGIVAAASAFRRARRGSAARIRSKAYLLAFVSRDVAWLTLGSALAVSLIIPNGDDWFPWFLYAVVLEELLFVFFLNYGILRFHLFNLDYGIKLGISRGTVAAILLGGFFIVSSVASNWLEQWGWLLGGVVTGMMLFLINPLMRFGERLASAAVPDAKPLARMTDRERLDIYRHQVEVAWEDGNLSRKERRMLEVSRHRLGVDEKDAHQIERKIVGA